MFCTKLFLFEKLVLEAKTLKQRRSHGKNRKQKSGAQALLLRTIQRQPQFLKRMAYLTSSRIYFHWWASPSLITWSHHLMSIFRGKAFKRLFTYTLFHIRMLFFSGQAEYSYFSADFSLKIFLYYSWIIIEKERIYHILFAVCSFIYYRYVFQSCTVHRTVISTEHLAITNAGFFVLLGSFAVGGSNDLIRLSYKHIF